MFRLLKTVQKLEHLDETHILSVQTILLKVLAIIYLCTDLAILGL